MVGVIGSKYPKMQQLSRTRVALETLAMRMVSIPDSVSVTSRTDAGETTFFIRTGPKHTFTASQEDLFRMLATILSHNLDRQIRVVLSNQRAVTAGVLMVKPKVSVRYADPRIGSSSTPPSLP